MNLMLSFIFGIIVGSFLNVCIYRIPRKEDIVYTPSHCMGCGNRIKWYDLIPILSFVLLRGKCRVCKTKLSIQYPLIELINGLVYLYLYSFFGLGIKLFIGCALFSTLLVISIIDARTRTIPNGINIFIGVLAIINLIFDLQHWSIYLLGFFVVSLLLFLIAVFTRGKGMGGGDIKLMAVAGLLLGGKHILLALILGCFIATAIYLPSIIGKLITKKYKFGSTIPFGPFLCAGIMLAYLYGNEIITWYIDKILGI